jgi:fructokinase
MQTLYGGLEAGGTKFVCAVGTGPEDLRAELRLPTTTPEETIGRAIAFFREQEVAHGKIAALGIGSFGPVDLDRASPTWGYITSTPKAGWRNTDLASAMGRQLGVPVAFDTDVNAAALGEQRWGAARGIEDFVYVTVGTGIGGGVMAGGKLVHGLLHPEIGHLRVPQDRAVDPFSGICPFHGNCLEGLANGPAIAARWGRKAEELPEDHPAWDLEAEYLGQLAATLTMVLSPKRILLGGGVMRQSFLLPRIRNRLAALFGGYLRSPVLEDLETYLQPPALDQHAGVFGALCLAGSPT